MNMIKTPRAWRAVAPLAGHAVAAALALTLLATPAMAQNLTIVNGKPVPKARVDALLQQAERAGQAVTPELQTQARDQVVLREIFVQEAERRGLAQRPAYRDQMELARQGILIRELFEDHRAKNPVTDERARAEYDKFKAAASGLEYRARHILVDSEDQARQLITRIKAGASFEDMAREHSKDPGSGANGGDLDFAQADAYVPEFGNAMKALAKGQMTDAPVKSDFGWHIIRLEETREAPFPAFDDVKDQLKQRLEQQAMQEFQEELRSKARTDYKFSQ
jgi:peptidyl-prolyl cis-trans isomerase C